MTHWSEQYLPLEWSNTFDCVELVRLVMREQCGKEIPMPGGFDWRRMKVDDVIDLAGDYAYPVSEPVEFDSLLMKIMGHRTDLGSHIGAVSIISDRAWVLHNIEKAGATFTPVDRLEKIFLSPVGFYRWK